MPFLRAQARSCLHGSGEAGSGVLSHVIRIIKSLSRWLSFPVPFSALPPVSSARRQNLPQPLHSCLIPCDHSCPHSLFFSVTHSHRLWPLESTARWSSVVVVRQRCRELLTAARTFRYIPLPLLAFSSFVLMSWTLSAPPFCQWSTKAVGTPPSPPVHAAVPTITDCSTTISAFASSAKQSKLW
jgi:hypothetical protein